MAPIEIHTAPSLLPAGVVLTHVLTTGYLSLVVGRTLYRSYVALPPSSATRHREPSRRSYVHAFSILALVSLVIGSFFAVKFSSLSYKVWATERGVQLPESIFGDKGALRGGEHPGRLHIASWLNDTPFYQDSLEIVAEKSRYFWWGQQSTLALVSWSLYLAIEGQRRNISNTWAFLGLAQLVNLSYAQNLFFLAVLLTPVPLPGNVREITRTSVPITSSRYSRFLAKVLPTKPEGFLPNPKFYIILLLSNFGWIFLIPFATNTPSFLTVTFTSRVLFPTSYLILPYVIPTSWGVVHTDPHEAQKTYITLFRLSSALSGLLHLKSTLLTLFNNTPESTYYRHSLLHPFKEEHRSALNRSSTAFSRVLGAVGEHPAVSAIGWDVILTGLSLGVWAATRGLDPNEMLRAVTNFIKPSTTTQDPCTTIAKTKSEPEIEKSTIRLRAGRPKKEKDTAPEIGDNESTALTSRRRGRSTKKSKDFDADEDADSLYQPTESDIVGEGDENIDEDWEAGALAWGLISLGGLGLGSAGVLGAEVRAR